MPGHSPRILLALLIPAAAGCFDTQPGDIAGGGEETTEALVFDSDRKG